MVAIIRFEFVFHLWETVFPLHSLLSTDIIWVEILWLFLLSFLCRQFTERDYKLYNTVELTIDTVIFCLLVIPSFTDCPRVEVSVLLLIFPFVHLRTSPRTRKDACRESMLKVPGCRPVPDHLPGFKLSPATYMEVNFLHFIWNDCKRFWIKTAADCQFWVPFFW